MAEEIRVEVVFALADRQKLTAVTLSQGSTVANAIAESAIAQSFPGENLDLLEVGIWGRVVSKDHILSNGDRVEIYRPLKLDPRKARRQLASLGLTMGTHLKD